MYRKMKQSFNCFWLLAFMTACGSPKKDKHHHQPIPGVEGAFNQAEKDFGIPKRFLLAVAYLESRLVSTMGSATYVSTDPQTGPVLRGTILSETAFGLPMSILGLDPQAAESQSLPSQISAYASYVSKTIQSKGITLPPHPANPDQIFQWIETLATIHRRGMTQRRNVQILFAKEMINILNAGFIWQDPNQDAVLELTPEPTKIDIETFPINARNWFRLTELDSELRLATYLPLVTVSSGETRDQPRRIEVIHCPLSLSGCLELQSRTEESQVKLSAHYIIPDDRSLISRAIQVADHSEGLLLTEANGTAIPHKGSVIIMLTGQSGRIVKGIRSPAIPTWFNDIQLRMMGQLINDLCTLFSQKNPEIKRDECMTIGGENGVKFHLPHASEEFIWGFIPDYDATIFDAYIKNPSGLNSEIAFDPQVGKLPTVAGQGISFKVHFHNESRILEMERLSRCSNGELLWEPIRHIQVRNKTDATLVESFFDSGPNRDGTQFLRVRIYGKDGKLLGWATQKIGLTKFESEPYFASDKHCNSHL